MNTNLSRVQIYLKPDDVVSLDDIATRLKITRSQIIRDAVSAVAKKYLGLVGLLDTNSSKRNPLLDLVGIEKSKTGTIGLNVDEIYQDD